jgi:hypothetical protein
LLDDSALALPHIAEAGAHARWIGTGLKGLGLKDHSRAILQAHFEVTKSRLNSSKVHSATVAAYSAGRATLLDNDGKPNGVITMASTQIIGPLTVGTFKAMMPDVICKKVKLTSQIPTRRRP